MGAIGFFEMLILLVALGGVVGVPLLIVVALVKNRPGLAAGVAVGAVLLVMGLGLFAAILIPALSAHKVVITSPNSSQIPLPSGYTTDGMHFTVNGIEQPWSSFSGGGPKWSIALMPMLFLACGAVFLIAMAARRVFAHSAAGGHRMIWPALIALPLLALFLLGGVRYHVSSSSNAQQAAQQAIQQTEIVQQQMMAQAQQSTMARHAAATEAEMQNRIAKMDIHELMDKFDAPRIALQAPSVPSPATALLTLAAALQQPAVPEVPVVPVPEAPIPEARVPEAPQPPVPSEAPKPLKHKRTTKPAAPPVKEVVANQPAKAMQAESPQASTTTKADTSKQLKPAWINTPPKRTGDVRREVIETEEYATPDECYQAADVYLLFKTFEHVQQMLNLPYQEGDLPSVTFQNGSIFANGNLIAVGRNSPHWTDSRPRYLDSLGIGIDFIRREIVAKDPKNNESCEYLETVDRSVGPMKKLYMQMEFTPAIDRQIQDRLDALARKSRIGTVGLSAVSVLGLLSLVWGLLKIDTATKGYYSKWLFIGVPTAIIGVTLVSLLALSIRA